MAKILHNQCDTMTKALLLAMILTGCATGNSHRTYHGYHPSNDTWCRRKPIRCCTWF